MKRLVLKKKAANKESQKPETQSVENKADSIWEILDYNAPFNLMYSGVENEGYFDVLYDCGIRDFLMSYHYLQNMHINMEKRFGGKGVRLFIDSGAHTYQNDPKYENVTVEEWEEHLKKYLKWVERNKDYIFAIASFDFENVVGAEKVSEWNRKYFEPFMLHTGIPVCFVWHQNSYYDWKSYCQRYPYVGFSSVNTEGVAIDLNEYKDKLKTAEKYGSVVHGFGMTRTSMLTELPFYTVDSTTWLVGLQYGEINYWTGSKMTRLKKEKWKGQMLDNICSKYGLDPEKMAQEETSELIKANIFAFIEAVYFIQTHLKKMMYWMKVKSVKNDRNNLPADFFPPPDGNVSGEQILEYAKRFNINVDIPGVADLVSDVSVICNWDNPEYEGLKSMYLEEDSKLLRGIHDDFINKIVDTDEERVADLQNFFWDCIEGKNETLLQMGTNFDRQQLERDEYVEDDDEYDLVDVPKEEVLREVQGLLPSRADAVPDEKGAPEIDSLDKEIFSKAEIVPLFDENGKFVKGQKKVKKPKQVYSKKYPKLVCDNCFAAAKCPEYKAGGYVCAYNKMFKRFDTRNMNDIVDGVQGIVNFNMERMQKGMLFETLNGNIDPMVSSLMDTNMKYLLLLKDMYDHASAETLRQTRVVRADGSIESTTQISNPQSGGILEKIFGGMETPMQEDDKKKVRNSDSEVIEAKVVESDAKDSSPAS